MAPALVCTTPGPLVQLMRILDNNLPAYNESVAGAASNRTAYARLFAGYADGELWGALNWLLYVDPLGREPWAVPVNTTLAALMNQAVENAEAYAYQVESTNTVATLLSLEVQLNVRDLEAQINADFGALGNDINVARAEAEGYANARALQVQANLNAQAGALGNDINVARAEANAYTTAVAHDLGIDINNARAQANAYTAAVGAALGADINKVKAELSSVVGLDVTSLTQQIAAEANKAEQEVKNAVATAEQYANGLTQGAVAGAVAQAVAQLQPQINAIKTETTECLDPLCDTVTPNAKNLGNLGKLLGYFTDAAGLGLLLALLEEAAHNPGQIVQDAENDLAGFVNSLAGGIRDLIGV